MVALRTQLRLIIVSIGLLLIAAASAPSFAQGGEVAGRAEAGDTRGSTAPSTPDETAELYRLVKRFDFAERDDGNFDAQPMYWAKLTGRGFAYDATGRFDHEHGHPAPPSFELQFSLDNVAYEYQDADLTVEPESDYFVSAYVQAENLTHARAFLAAYLVDRFGDRIAGSERISNLVGSTGRSSEPWQRLELDMVGDFPQAYAMRLQCWVLQNYVWRDPQPTAIDPIVDRDRLGVARFDDIRIHRLPRARLKFSSPAGLVRADREEAFILEVDNATAQPLRAVLSVTDPNGARQHRQALDVPSRYAPSSEGLVDPLQHAVSGQSGVRLPIPKLPPGVYEAKLELHGGGAVLLERRKRFAVLPQLPPHGPPFLDLGVDLGCWRRGNVEGVRELLEQLHCGAVKVGVPMIGKLDTPERLDYYNELTRLLRVLNQDRIETTGVVLTQSAAVDPERGMSTLALLDSEQWQELLKPVLAHFGGLLSTWQVGFEPLELRVAPTFGGWARSDVEAIRAQLKRFMTLPEVAAPATVTARGTAVGDVVTFHVPKTVPARVFPQQLDFLRTPSSRGRWLYLESPATGLDRLARLRALAQRVILAKALGPDRLYVPAPFDLSARAGSLGWEPTEDFIALRTLFHELSGKSAIGALTLDNETIAVIFAGGGEACVALWTWADTPAQRPLELYLGGAPRLLDLWGRTSSVEVVDGRAQLPVEPMPQLVTNVDSALALMQASFRVRPDYVQIHAPAPIQITFQNHFDARLSGELRLRPPEGWTLDPSAVHFDLASGEVFEQACALAMPSRQLAAKRNLEIEVQLFSPRAEMLRFDAPIQVGLPDIAMDARARWDGDTLVVTQSVRNMSEEMVDFDAFCNLPGLPREQRFFLKIAPGELREAVYTYPQARQAARRRALLGIKEIRGSRTLDTVVEVPE